jgi:hypothetical protein
MMGISPSVTQPGGVWTMDPGCEEGGCAPKAATALSANASVRRILIFIVTSDKKR